MQSKTLSIQIFVVIISFLIMGSNSLNDLGNFPLLPVKFTEAFVLTDTQTKITSGGKSWYDSTVLSSRFDFVNGAPACLYIYPNSTDCSVLIVNQTGYMILPSKNLCCLRPTDLPIQRDLFDFLSYKGEKQIDDISYDYWLFNGQAGFPATRYWTQKGDKDKRIPRRFMIGNDVDYQMIDFWSNSYSQNFDSKVVFVKPANCTRQCTKGIFQENIFEKKQNKHLLSDDE